MSYYHFRNAIFISAIRAKPSLSMTVQIAIFSLGQRPLVFLSEPRKIRNLLLLVSSSGVFDPIVNADSEI